MILRVLFVCVVLLAVGAHRPRPEPRVCLSFHARRVVGTEPWPIAYVQRCATWASP